MENTTKTTKTRKPGKNTTTTNKKATATKANKTRTAAMSLNSDILDRIQQPITIVRDLATRSLRLGLGIGAYFLTTPTKPRKIKFPTLNKNFRQDLDALLSTTLKKGAEVEQQQREWLSQFEQTQRQRVSEFFTARQRDLQRAEIPLEEKIGEILANLDIPTRSDLNQLNRRINELSKELAKQRGEESTNQKKAAKATKPTPVSIVSE
jgi:polyhydroxyalkanoate synthesis regulator phasin